MDKLIKSKQIKNLNIKVIYIFSSKKVIINNTCKRVAFILTNSIKPLLLIMALQTQKIDSVIKKTTLDFRNDRYNLSSQNELLMFYPFSADLFGISLKTLCGNGILGTFCAALHATG